MRGIVHAEDFGWSNAPRVLAGITAGQAILGGSAISGLGSIVGGGKSSSASKQAAQQSLMGTIYGIQNQQAMFNATRAGLSPWANSGSFVLPMLGDAAFQPPAGQGYLDAASNELAANDAYRNQAQGYLGQAADLANQPSAGQPYLTQASNELAANDAYRNQAQGYLAQASGMLPGNVLTQANLEATPGYQFTLQQGLKSTLAANAARGLGVSGASLKGAAQYATGLADATYSNRFNEAQQNWTDVINQSNQALNLGSNAQNVASGYLNQGSFAQQMQQQRWANMINQSNQALNLGANAQNTATGYVGQGTLAQQMQQQHYNQLYNIASMGESAAAGVGTAGTAAANAISSGITSGTAQAGNYLQNAGQAQAAGTVGVGNAINSGINNYLAYNNYQQMNQALQGIANNNQGQSYNSMAALYNTLKASTTDWSGIGAGGASAY